MCVVITQNCMFSLNIHFSRAKNLDTQLPLLSLRFHLLSCNFRIYALMRLPLLLRIIYMHCTIYAVFLVCFFLVFALREKKMTSGTQNMLSAKIIISKLCHVRSLVTLTFFILFKLNYAKNECHICIYLGNICPLC